MVRALGHTVTATHPALVPLVLRSGFFHAALRGISHPAELSTFADGKRIDRRSGSLLWTHFGISGPVVLDASRHWVLARADGAAVELRIGFFPGESAAAVEERLRALAGERPRASLGRLLAMQLPERLATTLLDAADVDPATPIGQLARDARRRLVRVLTELVLPVETSRGWDYAEVTAGGVPLAEIDYRTMASRKADGLYLVGEMLDCDGRIGGFNFQWAWATGYLAGRAAVRSIAGIERPLVDTGPNTSHVRSMKSVNALELRQSLGKVLRALEKDGAPILVERAREPSAVLISLKDYRSASSTTRRTSNAGRSSSGSGACASARRAGRRRSTSCATCATAAHDGPRRFGRGQVVHRRRTARGRGADDPAARSRRSRATSLVPSVHERGARRARAPAGRYGRAGGRSARLIEALGLHRVANGHELLATAARLAVDWGLSGYDATYVALASLLGGTWLTADERAAKRVRTRKLVRILGPDAIGRGRDAADPAQIRSSV